jgi:hypothetical protein
VALEFGIEDRVKSGTWVARNGFVGRIQLRLEGRICATTCRDRGVPPAPAGKSASLRFPKETRVKLRVQCYAGHRGEEEPRAFDLGDRRIEVMKIIDRWLSTNHLYFKSQAYNGSVYILRHK